ncbi:MAG TPA: hypothetical protein VGQ59_08320 [Cyclobacteriaceae bacterium]|jgi:hypothetical protein|nr:hypothetical protein [Cyclobacteriaceae bacterium]
MSNILSPYRIFSIIGNDLVVLTPTDMKMILPKGVEKFKTSYPEKELSSATEEEIDSFCKENIWKLALLKYSLTIDRRDGRDVCEVFNKIFDTFPEAQDYMFSLLETIPDDGAHEFDISINFFDGMGYTMRRAFSQGTLLGEYEPFNLLSFVVQEMQYTAAKSWFEKERKGTLEVLERMVLVDLIADVSEVPVAVAVK